MPSPIYGILSEFFDLGNFEENLSDLEKKFMT